MKRTETIESILREMQRFNGYEDMTPAEQLAIAEDVKYEIEEYDVFLHEYLSYRFDTLTQEQRRQYLPISEYAWRLPENVNKQPFPGKYVFNKNAKQFISREFICIEDASREAFGEFLKRHEKIIIKPLFEQCGTGITVYNTADWNPDALYDELIANNTPLAEEYVYQHPDMAKFHPGSLNTVRMVTFTDFNGKIAVEMCGLKTGVGNSVCDNMGKGGIWAPVDINTGIIADDALDGTCHHYAKHPDTGVVFKGSVIPCFDKMMQKVDEYVGFFNDLHLVGWDIAIKDNGDIELMEANYIPDMVTEQLLFKPLAEIYKKLYVEGNNR